MAGVCYLIPGGVIDCFKVRADCQGAIEHLNKVETAQTVSLYVRLFACSPLNTSQSMDAQQGLKKALGPRLAGSVYIILSKTLGVYVARLTKLG